MPKGGKQHQHQEEWIGDEEEKSVPKEGAGGKGKKGRIELGWSAQCGGKGRPGNCLKATWEEVLGPDGKEGWRFWGQSLRPLLLCLPFGLVISH